MPSKKPTNGDDKPVYAESDDGLDGAFSSLRLSDELRVTHAEEIAIAARQRALSMMTDTREASCESILQVAGMAAALEREFVTSLTLERAINETGPEIIRLFLLIKAILDLLQSSRQAIDGHVQGWTQNSSGVVSKLRAQARQTAEGLNRVRGHSPLADSPQAETASGIPVTPDPEMGRMVERAQVIPPQIDVRELYRALVDYLNRFLPSIERGVIRETGDTSQEIGQIEQMLVVLQAYLVKSGINQAANDRFWKILSRFYESLFRLTTSMDIHGIELSVFAQKISPDQVRQWAWQKIIRLQRHISQLELATTQRSLAGRVLGDDSPRRELFLRRRQLAAAQTHLAQLESLLPDFKQLTSSPS
ncbi:MAG: hypothetical protein V1760_02090 [Candidatus Peregrinibacteria bacterium]